MSQDQLHKRQRTSLRSSKRREGLHHRRPPCSSPEFGLQVTGRSHREEGVSNRRKTWCWKEMKVVEQPKQRLYLVLAVFRRSPPQNRRKTGQLRRKTREDGQEKEGTDLTRFGGFKKKREVRCVGGGGRRRLLWWPAHTGQREIESEGGGSDRER